MSAYPFDSLRPLKQKAPDQYQPQEQEILEYAQFIGIVLPQESYMLPLAKQGVLAQLPQQWQACHTAEGELVYRNIRTRVVQEQHPLDQFYREKVIEYRGLYAQEGQGQEQQDLQTITEQRSDDRSLNSELNRNYDDFMPSRQMSRSPQPLHPQSTHQLSDLNKAVYLDNSREMSITLQQQGSRLLNLSLLNNTHRELQLKPQSRQAIAEQSEREQTEREKLEALRDRLEGLRRQEDLARQLLEQLVMSNAHKREMLGRKLGGRERRKKVFNH